MSNKRRWRIEVDVWDLTDEKRSQIDKLLKEMETQVGYRLFEFGCMNWATGLMRLPIPEGDYDDE